MSHTTSFDQTILPCDTDEEIIPSGATTPLEIQPGDPLLRPRSLHLSTVRRPGHKAAPTSFASPATSLAPSSHPPCPPSRAPSPDTETLKIPHTIPAHRWVLHPRRGHAALNSGLKSLSGRALTVVGRPDDLLRAGGESLGQGELGEVEKKDLERGLKNMAGVSEEGIGCVPVWLDDKVHYSMLFLELSRGGVLTAGYSRRLLRRHVQDVPLASLPLPRTPRLARQEVRARILERLLRDQPHLRQEGGRGLQAWRPRRRRSNSPQDLVADGSACDRSGFTTTTSSSSPRCCASFFTTPRLTSPFSCTALSLRRSTFAASLVRPSSPDSNQVTLTLYFSQAAKPSSTACLAATSSLFRRTHTLATFSPRAFASWVTRLEPGVSTQREASRGLGIALSVSTSRTSR